MIKTMPRTLTVLAAACFTCTHAGETPSPIFIQYAREILAPSIEAEVHRKTVALHRLFGKIDNTLILLMTANILKNCTVDPEKRDPEKVLSLSETLKKHAKAQSSGMEYRVFKTLYLRSWHKALTPEMRQKIESEMLCLTAPGIF